MLKRQSFSSNLCHSTHLNRNELIFVLACKLMPPLPSARSPASSSASAPATQPSCMPRANITYLCLVVANNFCRPRAVAPAVNDTTANKVHTHTHRDIVIEKGLGDGRACCVMAKLISFARKQVLKHAFRPFAVWQALGYIHMHACKKSRTLPAASRACMCVLTEQLKAFKIKHSLAIGSLPATRVLRPQRMHKLYKRLCACVYVCVCSTNYHVFSFGMANVIGTRSWRHSS